ncbi:MAG TPA: SDR family oxidoreductase [Nocardia sp.]|uniref:SDR family oxidoreductase n=1 Tax=Nocardia TaxID=1817 RepID=UPI002454C4BF|nr:MULTISPECIES: SDR family oxidoreductase [Nocardia]HLS76747.1 SDR family oxidoreductase [Nocardia sp.]
MAEGDRRVCLLTGADSSFGELFCQAMRTDYDIVAVCGEQTPAVVSQLEWFVDPFAPRTALPENTYPVYVLRADLTAEGEPERIADLALARFGGVDLLVNAATPRPDTTVSLLDADATLADFLARCATAVAAPLRLAARLAQRCWLHDPRTNRARNRNIVNVSALTGSTVAAGQAAHGAAMAALDQLTKHLAVEYSAFGVRANALAPDRFPERLPVEQVVRAVAELDAGEMTGRVFGVAADTAG